VDSFGAISRQESSNGHGRLWWHELHCRFDGSLLFESIRGWCRPPARRNGSARSVSRCVQLGRTRDPGALRRCGAPSGRRIAEALLCSCRSEVCLKSILVDRHCSSGLCGCDRRRVFPCAWCGVDGEGRYRGTDIHGGIQIVLALYSAHGRRPVPFPPGLSDRRSATSPRPWSCAFRSSGRPAEPKVDISTYQFGSSQIDSRGRARRPSL